MVVSIGWVQIFTRKNRCFTKHQFKNGCLEFQAYAKTFVIHESNYFSALHFNHSKQHPKNMLMALTWLPPMLSLSPRNNPPFWSNGAVDARHGSRGGGALRGQGAQDITVTVRWAHDGAGKPAGEQEFETWGALWSGLINHWLPLIRPAIKPFRWG